MLKLLLSKLKLIEIRRIFLQLTYKRPLDVEHDENMKESAVLLLLLIYLK